MGPPFVLPADALSPQATGEAPMLPPEAAGLKQIPADGLDDLFGPAIPVPGSEFLAGTGLETLEAPATDYSTFGEYDSGSASRKHCDALSDLHQLFASCMQCNHI